MSKPVFENDMYYVKVHVEGSPLRYSGLDYTTYYVLVNKETLVVEFASPQLPEIISAAEQLAVAMETKPWEWVRASIPPKVNPDGTLAEPEVH